MKNKDNELSAEDSRALHITEAILIMAREAISEKLAQCEQSAADVAEDADQDDGKPIMAKLTLAIRWPAGAQNAKVELKATHSVSRSISFSAVADGNQSKLTFAE